MFYLKKFSSFVFALSILLGLSSTAAANLDRQEINQLYGALGRSSFETFTDFL